MISFPFQLLMQIMSVLARMVFRTPTNTDIHELLQRRLTQLEAEVEKLKPVGETIPKHKEAAQLVAVDSSHKITSLETELANTKKVGSNPRMHFTINFDLKLLYFPLHRHSLS